MLEHGVNDDYNSTIKDIEKFRAILSSDSLVLDIIKKEVRDIRERYGDERRTEIIMDVQDIDIEDLIVDEDISFQRGSSSLGFICSFGMPNTFLITLISAFKYGFPGNRASRALSP